MQKRLHQRLRDVLFYLLCTKLQAGSRYDSDSVSKSEYVAVKPWAQQALTVRKLAALHCKIISIIPQREDISIQVAPMPWDEVYHGQQGYAFCWDIPASSQQKDAAWNLLQFLICSVGFPGYSYSEDTELLDNAAQELWYEQYVRIEGASNGRDFFEQTQAVRKLPVSRFDEPYGWYDAVCVPILKFMSDESTLDEALETANDNWERFILE